MNPAGITVAVPFGPGPDWLTGAVPTRYNSSKSAGYVEAIRREVDKRAPDFSRQTFTTVFFAGCGPSLLSLDHLYSVLQALCDRLTVDLQEQTLVVLPGSVDEGKAKVLRESGFDRAVLRLDGRLDSRDFGVLRDAGFATVGVELAYGAGDAWDGLLDSALEPGPDHVTFYFIPDGPSRVESLQGFRQARKRMAGWHNYALHHYCQPGRECRHIVATLSDVVVAGFGPGAVSRVGRTVFRNPGLLADCLSGRIPAEEERLPADLLVDELLRLEGIEHSAVPPARARLLVEAGLLEKRSGRLFLSDQGVLALDRVRSGLAGS